MSDLAVSPTERSRRGREIRRRQEPKTDPHRATPDDRAAANALLDADGECWACGGRPRALKAVRRQSTWLAECLGRAACRRRSVAELA